MVVDDRPGHPGGPRHRLDRDAAVALLDDHAERGVDQLLAALPGRQARRVRPAPAGCGVRGHREGDGQRRASVAAVGPARSAGAPRRSTRACAAAGSARRRSACTPRSRSARPISSASRSIATTGRYSCSSHSTRGLRRGRAARRAPAWPGTPTPRRPRPGSRSPTGRTGGSPPAPRSGSGTRSKNTRSWLLSGRSLSLITPSALDPGDHLGHVGVDVVRVPARAPRTRDGGRRGRSRSRRP